MMGYERMINVTKYNLGIALRWNKLLRKMFILPLKKKKLKNKDFTLLCNNCAGGILSHDLNLQFRSPTINLFFYYDHFYKFCENFDYYIAQPLTVCENPIHTPSCAYPVCNLGDLELHFLHYSSFEEAKQKWDSRTARIDKDNIFVIWTFFDETDPKWAARFDKLPFKNKVAFTEKDFPEYPSLFRIRGVKEVRGVTEFNGLTGHRKIDQFDYIKWFNQGKELCRK